LRDLQHFCGRYPSFLLSQCIQPFQRVLDIILPQYLLQKIFWKDLSQERSIDVDRLTRSSLLHLLRRDPKNCEHFDHGLDGYARHRRSRRDFCVWLKTLEEVLHA